MDDRNKRMLLAQALMEMAPKQNEQVTQQAPQQAPQSMPMPVQQPQQSQMPPADQLFRQGALALQNYDYPSAAMAWQKALSIDPNHLQSRVSLDHINRLMSQNTRLGRSTVGDQRGYR